MFCPNCGTPADENQTQCSKCGVPLTPQNQQTDQPTQKQSTGLGLAITSMILGIVALVLFCLVYVAIPCAVVGVALGGVAMSKAKKANAKCGMAIAGITCSCVALGILIILIIIVGTSGLAISNLLF